MSLIHSLLVCFAALLANKDEYNHGCRFFCSELPIPIRAMFARFVAVLPI